MEWRGRLLGWWSGSAIQVSAGSKAGSDKVLKHQQDLRQANQTHGADIITNEISEFLVKLIYSIHYLYSNCLYNY